MEAELQERALTMDEQLVPRLRAGDETAFAELVDRLHGRLLGLARTFTSSPGLAEDMVQETWLAVIRGLPGFEGRSALTTWIFAILVRRARTMAAREAKRGRLEAGANGAAPDAAEWEPGAGRRGLWESTPVPWALEDPAALYQSGEALEVVRTAFATLPEGQRQVVFLRDVQDMPSREVCNILDLSETNVRVLLHRGRARIRRALDRYLREGEPTPRPVGRPVSGGS
jgi:RNA polymerase sigma-70 factor (ECF subfamily)